MSGSHVGRASLVLLAAVGGLGCCVLVGWLVTGGVDPALRGDAVVAAWVAGIVSVLLAVLALQERSNPDDDPRYLATVVQGLRDEWRR